MQEQNTNVQQQIDGMMEQMKADISKQVKQELQEKGITVIDNSYDGFKDVVKLVNTYESKVEAINKEIAHNTETYSDSVCKVKNYELHLDLQDAKDDTLKELDEVITKVEKLQDRAIKDKQADPHYREMRQEALNVVSLLANVEEIPTDILLSVLDDVISASDIKTLSICKVLVQNNAMASYSLERAIDEIKVAQEQRELHAMVDTMKRYIEVGDNELSVMLWKNRVVGDK